MKFEKFVGSKTYNFMDWIFRLLVLNILILLLSLTVVLLLPAISAGYSTIKDYQDGKSGIIFKIFFDNFKEHFRKSIICGIILTIIIAILGFAVYSYYHAATMSTNLLYTFGLYFSLFCLLLVFIIFFQLPIIFNYFHFRIWDNFRFAFYISFRYLILTLIIYIAWGLSALGLLWWPIWAMLGLSGPLYIIERFSRQYYSRIAEIPNDEYEDEGSD